MEWFNLDDSVNALALLGAVAILVLTIFIAGGYIKKMKDSRSEGELTKDDWDGIKEYKNDIPIGWGLAFIALIVWGVWYWFAGYPLSGYSQIGEYNEETQSYNAKFEAKWQNISQADLIKMGESMFLAQCSQCHGITGKGNNNRAANLSTWGRGEEGIIAAIENGSKNSGYMGGAMAPLDISNEDKKAVAAFVMAEISELKSTKNPELVARGREVFTEATCTACHGEDGKGNGGFAADLSKWGTPAFVADVLEYGKQGVIGTMPSFKTLQFSDKQKEALGQFIFSLK